MTNYKWAQATIRSLFAPIYHFLVRQNQMRLSLLDTFPLVIRHSSFVINIKSFIFGDET